MSELANTNYPSRGLVVALIVMNAILLILLIASHVPSVYASQTVQPVLRGHALEIVDEQGRVRASISVHGPETVAGKTYPERVLFRMADQNRSPKVKWTVSEEGTAMGMSDDAEGGVSLIAKRTGTFVKVVDRQGHERVIKPLE